MPPAIAVPTRRSALPDAPGELARRADAAEQQLAACTLCRHACGCNRLTGESGRCATGAVARQFYAGLNYAVEEPYAPQFSLFFTGCGLRCAICWARDHVLVPERGDLCDAVDLNRRTAAAAAAGARSIGLLGGSPTVNLAAALAYLAAVPTTLPLVWNTEGQEHAAARTLLTGLVDAYVVSVKFGNDNCALRHAGAPDYLTTLMTNVRWMAGQAPVIACLLIMPGHEDCCGSPARALFAGLPGVAMREEPPLLQPPAANPPPWRSGELMLQIGADGSIVCPIISGEMMSAAAEFAILKPMAEARR